MTIVATRSGKVEGFERDCVLVFRGIPYAAPPVGPRRWRAPEREPAWDGVRDCTQVAPYIAQADMMLEQMLGSGTIAKDEGALVLNVWTPGLDGRRPVMVWIHGGAYTAGGSSQPVYDGCRLAAEADAVIVTINYRLGALGFLSPVDAVPGGDTVANAGLHDQLAALAWVRTHAPA